MTLEPVSPKKRPRITARQRKKLHVGRVGTKLAPVAVKSVKPVVKPAEPDAELAAEIAAMKADDARKGKYYSRKKADV